ncbi:phosphoadenosine phosphosulfate reductase, partial [Escherichia coli]|nr:phosphoadenosine phosphosulfate reductase [Escherichia coli]
MRDTFLTEKILIGENVLRAATARIEWIFETFPSVCLSFSGGKDSTVLFHLAAEVARRKKRRFSVLFIDWEAQYQCTIALILKMREMYRDVTET